MDVTDLPTPALVIDAAALGRNLDRMSAVHPGNRLRPHVKAHKCTALAATQSAHGHHGFTCATPREVLGMARAGLGDDLLLANETVDPARLRAMADLDPPVTVAIDSDATLDAAAAAGIRRVLVDVDVGLPRCGVSPNGAGALADRARALGIEVRGVMGYEGHLMMVTDRAEQAARVERAMGRLRAAHADVGGDIVSAGGTGTHDLHGATGVTEVQAGSYALMDRHYGTLGLPFEQAAWVVGTIISVSDRHAVADVGLKALGMDHGDPEVRIGDAPWGARTHRVWFCSDEHVTFDLNPDEGHPDDGHPDGAAATASDDATPVAVGGRVWVVTGHIDPTMAMHAHAWLARAGEVVDRWPIDLRGW